MWFLGRTEDIVSGRRTIDAREDWLALAQMEIRDLRAGRHGARSTNEGVAIRRGVVGAAHSGIGDEGVGVARCTGSVSRPRSTPLWEWAGKHVVLGQEPKVRAELQK